MRMHLHAQSIEELAQMSSISAAPLRQKPGSLKKSHKYLFLLKIIAGRIVLRNTRCCGILQRV